MLFLVFSILAYVVQEFWAAFRESRGRMLRKAVYDLLNDSLNKGFGVLLFEHPQFNFLKKHENRLPSYLPSSNFANALIDIIGREAEALRFLPHITESKTEVKIEYAPPKPTDTHSSVIMPAVVPEAPSSTDMFQRFAAGLKSMNNSNLKILLQNILAESNDLPTLKNNIEIWYNDYMDRVTGWYKDSVTVNLRWIGILIAIFFNVHALYVIKSIYGDRQLRDKLVQMGGNMVDNQEPLKAINTSSVQSSLAEIDNNCSREMQRATTDSQRNEIQKQCAEKRMALADSFAVVRRRQITAISDSLQMWDLPIGWKWITKKGTETGSAGSANTEANKKWWWWVLGWILSGLAISAGAPFWFELLSKMINIRRAGIRPATKADDKNKK